MGTHKQPSTLSSSVRGPGHMHDMKRRKLACVVSSHGSGHHGDGPTRREEIDEASAFRRFIWVSDYSKLWTSNVGELSVRTSARCSSLCSDNAIRPSIPTPPGTRYSRPFQANGLAAMKEIRCRFEWDIGFSLGE
ncbi:hypothetical protein BC629DRAFT_1119060 [Irpex lacteus]|nr:hypothetical protein BC629DRAFT_1119060 [Irpex lacteus]